MMCNRTSVVVNLTVTSETANFVEGTELFALITPRKVRPGLKFSGLSARARYPRPPPSLHPFTPGTLQTDARWPYVVGMRRRFRSFPW